jgi:hypothetical protein
VYFLVITLWWQISLFIVISKQITDDILLYYDTCDNLLNYSLRFRLPLLCGRFISFWTTHKFCPLFQCTLRAILSTFFTFSLVLCCSVNQINKYHDASQPHCWFITLWYPLFVLKLVHWLLKLYNSTWQQAISFSHIWGLDLKVKMQLGQSLWKSDHWLQLSYCNLILWIVVLFIILPQINIKPSQILCCFFCYSWLYSLGDAKIFFDLINCIRFWDDNLLSLLMHWHDELT